MKASFSRIKSQYAKKLAEQAEWPVDGALAGSYGEPVNSSRFPLSGLNPVFALDPGNRIAPRFTYAEVLVQLHSHLTLHTARGAAR
jgi:hypothetical protein